MTTLADKLAANAPQAIDLSEIPSVPELTVVGTGRQSQGGKPIFAAALDEAATVRATVYVSADAPALSKENSLVCGDASMRPITRRGDSNDGMRLSSDGSVIVTTYDFWPKGYTPTSRDPQLWTDEDRAKATSVITYAPAKAEIEAWSVKF